MVASDGMNSVRTTRVSSSRPMQTVEPNWPNTVKSLPSIAAIVKANTRPADVTTAPVPAIDRMYPVLSPA